MIATLCRRFGAFSRALELVSRWLAYATLTVSLVMTFGFVICLLLQILFRYALNSPLSWTGELAVFQFLWVVMLLASVGVRENFHVRLTVLVGSFGAWPREAIERAVMAAISAFGVFMIFAGLRFVDLTWGNTSAAIRYPLQALYLAAPVCGALIAVHGLARLCSTQSLADESRVKLPNVNGNEEAP